MSIVTYNGITLPYPFMTQFDQAPLRDDSDTDWYGTQFDIQIQTILNESFIQSIYPEIAAEGWDWKNPANLMRLVRTKLLEPRKEFSYKMNGVEMIPTMQEGNTGKIDAQNGPKPQSCRIVQMSDNTFLLSYHIKATYWENYNLGASTQDRKFVNQRSGNVLFNRWTETVTIDNCLYSIRSRQGKYIIRSDNAEQKQADEVREDMAVLGVPPGFNRISSEYTITPNGLGLEYRVVDKEVYRSPSYPAYEASGEYIETTTRMQNIRYGEARVRLKSSKFIPQNQLVRVAIAVVTDKLGRVGAAAQIGDGSSLAHPGAKFFTFLEYGMIKVDLFENIVEVVLRCRLAPDAGRIFGLAGMCDSAAKQYYDQSRKFMCQTLNTYPSGKGEPDYYSRGTANILLEAAKYYDPSLLNNRLISGPKSIPDSQLTVPALVTQMNNGQRVGEGGKAPT